MRTRLGALLLVASATLLVAALEASCDDKYFKYVNMIDRRRIGEFYHLNLLEALQNLNVEPDESPESTLAKIKQAAEATTDANHAKYYANLLALADEDDNCLEEMIDQTKYVLNLVRAEKPEPASEDFSVARLEGFLYHYGKTKFERCAIRADKYMSLQRHVEPALDEYFKEAMDVAGTELTEEQLFEKLKNYDLSRDPINVDGLLKLAQRSKDKRNEKDEQLLKKLVHYRCAPFKRPLSTNHDMLNLAKIFGSTHEFSLKFLKMNEYRRLCLSTRMHKDLSAVRQNFRYSLPKERPKNKGSMWNKISCKSVDVAK